MKDQQIIWINNPKIAWKWAMEWVEEAKTGNHYPVKHIIEAAKKSRIDFALMDYGVQVVNLYIIICARLLTWLNLSMKTHSREWNDL